MLVFLYAEEFGDGGMSKRRQYELKYELKYEIQYELMKYQIITCCVP